MRTWSSRCANGGYPIPGQNFQTSRGCGYCGLGVLAVCRSLDTGAQVAVDVTWVPPSQLPSNPLRVASTATQGVPSHSTSPGTPNEGACELEILCHRIECPRGGSEAPTYPFVSGASFTRPRHRLSSTPVPTSDSASAAGKNQPRG